MATMGIRSVCLSLEQSGRAARARAKRFGGGHCHGHRMGIAVGHVGMFAFGTSKTYKSATKTTSRHHEHQGYTTFILTLNLERRPRRDGVAISASNEIQCNLCHLRHNYWSGVGRSHERWRRAPVDDHVRRSSCIVIMQYRTLLGTI